MEICRGFAACEDPTGFVDLAVAFRKLHDVPKPVNLVLPLFDPVAGGGLLGLRRDHRGHGSRFLRQRVKDLYAEYDTLSFLLPAGYIHGDGRSSSLLHRTDGSVVMLDFEAFAWGPREWDHCSGLGVPFRGSGGWRRRKEISIASRMAIRSLA